MEAQNVQTNTTPSSVDLQTLSPEELIARINHLESRLKSTTAQLSALTLTTTAATSATKSSETTIAPQPATVTSSRFTKPKKAAKPFDFSRYSTRHIALKFAYLGQRYNGLEHANGDFPPLRPTVEEVLWKALRKARLIPPDVPDGCDGTFEVLFDENQRKSMYWEKRVRLEIDWTGLGYSKCGRTDKGVSAFGQVIGITVRSNRPKKTVIDKTEHSLEGEHSMSNGTSIEAEQETFDDVMDELQYMPILNSILPPDMRVLAWCPDPDNTFDARFSCKERRYKYFFTNPAFCPTPGNSGLNHANGERAPVREGWLDIEAMRQAAKKLEGLHDFRNFCKIDASKQMTSCERRITFADVEEMSADIGLNRFMNDPRLNKNGTNTELRNADESPMHGPRIYMFAVHGTAFLWHQVRCMVAVLFLVGQGLEQPEIVDKLLDINQNPARPNYDMADDAPLVLWDCIFPGDENSLEGGLNWIYAGDQRSITPWSRKGDSQYDGKFGMGGVVSDLWTVWREAKITETLSAGLLSLALSQGDGTPFERGGFRYGLNPQFRSQRLFEGGDAARSIGDYIPIMKKSRKETLEVQNAKYLAGKQTRRDLKRSESTN